MNSTTALFYCDHEFVERGIKKVADASDTHPLLLQQRNLGRPKGWRPDPNGQLLWDCELWSERDQSGELHFFPPKFNLDPFNEGLGEAGKCSLCAPPPPLLSSAIWRALVCARAPAAARSPR